jgi:hypothetical protein
LWIFLKLVRIHLSRICKKFYTYLQEDLTNRCKIEQIVFGRIGSWSGILLLLISHLLSCLNAWCMKVRSIGWVVIKVRQSASIKVNSHWRIWSWLPHWWPGWPDVLVKKVPLMWAKSFLEKLIIHLSVKNSIPNISAISIIFKSWPKWTIAQ